VKSKKVVSSALACTNQKSNQVLQPEYDFVTNRVVVLGAEPRRTSPPFHARTNANGASLFSCEPLQLTCPFSCRTLLNGASPFSGEPRRTSPPLDSGVYCPCHLFCTDSNEDSLFLLGTKWDVSPVHLGTNCNERCYLFSVADGCIARPFLVPNCDQWPVLFSAEPCRLDGPFFSSDYYEPSHLLASG
jgi:hypothetical protein